MRRCLALLSVLVLFEAISSRSAEPGLIGYWKLQGDCKDYSGQGNDGINHGVDLTAKDGASFDGAGHYVEVPDHPSLQLGTGDFSIAAWVKCRPGKTDVVGDILNKYDQKSRNGFNLHVSSTGTGYGGTSDVRNLQFGIDNAVDGDWTDCGKPVASNPLISALLVYQGQLYAGTTDAKNFGDACHVYRYAGGKNWVDCGRVRPDVNTRSIMTMIIHQGKLYVGTGTWDWEQSAASGLDHVYRYDGDTKWHDCGQFGKGRRVVTMSSFEGQLYANDDAGDSWRWDGEKTWTQCGHVPDYKMISSLVFRGKLYGGSSTQMWRYRGGTAWDVIGKFAWADVNQVHTMGVYEGNMYAGSWPLGRILRYDGDDKWAGCGDLGINTDKKAINEVNDLITYNGKFYAGVIPKAEVWRYEGGTNWTMIKQLVHHPDFSKANIPSWSRVTAMAIHDGRLFAGTGSCHARTAVADFRAELGQIFSYEAGKSVSYGDDLGLTWRHVTAVRAKDRLKLYVDSKLVSTSAGMDGAKVALTNSRPLLIGFGQENYFNGNLRNVRLYDQALSERDVQKLSRR
jgi:hypothetical protein